GAGGGCGSWRMGAGARRPRSWRRGSAPARPPPGGMCARRWRCWLPAPRSCPPRWPRRERPGTRSWSPAGTLIPIDRVAADRPFDSGKHHRHGMNLQVISSPAGEIVWLSGPLPGAVHDLTAARIWGIIRQLAAARLIVLADRGYIGGGQHVLTPYRGRTKPASQKAANSAHAKLRAPSGRANAQLKT